MFSYLYILLSFAQHSLSFISPPRRNRSTHNSFCCWCRCHDTVSQCKAQPSCVRQWCKGLKEAPWVVCAPARFTVMQCECKTSQEKYADWFRTKQNGPDVEALKPYPILYSWTIIWSLHMWQTQHLWLPNEHILHVLYIFFPSQIHTYSHNIKTSAE